MSAVSFVVTVYNKAPYLADLVASLKAQEGYFAREFIFVDDGSRDDSVETLRRLTYGMENVEIIVQSNAGQARATNTGLARARLPYVKLVDADDILHPRCTQRLVAALEAFPDSPLAYCDHVIFQDGEPLPAVREAVAEAADILIVDPLRPLLKSCFANPSQLLVRTVALGHSGGAEDRVAHSMEYGLMLRLALLGPFVHVPEKLAFWRQGLQGNLSENQRLTLQESMRHPLLLFKDHPAIAPEHKRYAAIRVAKRAWLWRLRKRGDHLLSPHSLRRVAAHLPFWNPLSVMEASVRAMDETGAPRAD